MNYTNVADLSVAELLSITLKEKPGEELLAKFGSLRGLADASVDEILEAGLTTAAATQLKAILELGRRYTSESQKRRSIRVPADIVDMLAPEMQWLDREMFRCVYLNAKNMVLSIPVISIGTLDSCLVHPREVFKGAISRSAAAIIACHNHPSGIPEPSEADINITRRLKEAGQLLGITLVDHIIIGENRRYVSFKESGLI